MTQAQYIQQLEANLSALPQSRRDEILADIRAHFAEGVEAGIPENDLAEGLGEPRALAAEYVTLYSGNPPKKGRSGAATVLGAIGLGFLYLVLVLPLTLTAVSLWAALVITAAALILAGIAVPVLVILEAILPYGFYWLSVDYPMFVFFAGITVGSLGGILLILILRLGRGCGHVLASIWQFPGKFIRKGRAHHA